MFHLSGLFQYLNIFKCSCSCMNHVGLNFNSELGLLRDCFKICWLRVTPGVGALGGHLHAYASQVMWLWSREPDFHMSVCEVDVCPELLPWSDVNKHEANRIPTNSQSTGKCWSVPISVNVTQIIHGFLFQRRYICRSILCSGSFK